MRIDPQEGKMSLFTANRKYLKIVLFSVVLILFMAPAVFAQVTYYSQGDGDFSDTNNWNTIRTGGGSSPSDFEQGDIFYIQNEHEITLDAVDNVLGSLIIENGGTFDNSSNTIFFGVSGGGLTIEDGGTYTASTGTIEHAAGSLATIIISAANATDLYNVTTAGRLTLDGAAFTITGTLDIRTSQTFSLTNGASLSYGNSGTLTYNLSSRTVGPEWPTGNGASDGLYNLVLQAGTVTINTLDSFQVRNNLTRINGSLSVSTGFFIFASGATLEYTGSSNQTVGAEWPSNLPPTNVTLNKSASTLTSDAPLRVPRTLTMTSGTLAMGSNDLFIEGTLAGGDVAGGGTITSSGTITMGRNLQEQFKQTITGSLTLSNLTISKAYSGGTDENNTLEVTGSPTITGNLTLAAGFLNVGIAGDPGTINITGSGNGFIQNGGQVNLVNGSLSVGAGDITITAGTFTNTGGTVTISGSTNKLSVTNNALFVMTDAATAITANEIELLNSATYRTGGKVINNLTTLNLSTTSTFEFNGTSVETMPASPATKTFGNILLSNPAGLNVSGSATVLGTFTFNADATVNVTGSNTLTMGANASFSSYNPSRYVNGPLRITVDDSDDQVFPIGTANVYRPATFNWSTETPGTDVLQMRYLETNPGYSSLPAGITEISSAGHYTLERISGSTSGGYAITLDVTSAGYTPNDRNKILVQNGAGPVYDFPDNDVYDNFPNVTATASALPTNDFRLAFGRGGTATQITWDGEAGDGLWGSATNWNPDGVPTSTDNVVIDDVNGLTVTIGGSTSAQAASLTIGNDDGSTVNLIISTTSATPLTVTNALTLNNEGFLSFRAANGDISAGSTVFDDASTVEYRTRNIPVDSYGNLLINGATGTTGSGTIVVNGSLTKDGGNFNASNEITVTSTYTNTAGNATYNGGLTVSGNTTLTAGTVGGTVILNGSTVTVNGGSFGGTVTLSGSAAQSIAGSATATFNSLTVDNSNGIILNTNSSVGAILRLSNGVVTTGSNVFTILSSGTFDVENSTGYILGNSANQFGSTFVARYFPVGSSGRTRYVQLFGSSASGTISITCNLVDDPATNITTDLGGLLTKVSELRYYSFSNNSGVQFNIRRVEKLRVNNDDGVGDFINNTTLRMATTIGTGNTWAERTLGVANTQAPLPVDISSNNFSSDDAVSTGSVWYLALGTTDISDNPLPVQLAAFEALADFGKVTLNWTTASELDNLGFNIYRADADENNWQQINSQLIAGQGNTAQSTDYSFVDSKVVGGETYHYKLESVSTNGLRVDEKTIEVNIPLPDQYVLFNNYPNPFNPTTNIKFQLPEAQPVKMVIYDMNGSQVKTLLNNQVYHAGEHVVSWDASDQNGNRVASGIYLYRFQAGSYHKTGKMILVK